MVRAGISEVAAFLPARWTADHRTDQASRGLNSRAKLAERTPIGPDTPSASYGSAWEAEAAPCTWFLGRLKRSRPSRWWRFPVGYLRASVRLPAW
jgi:hypothetical protein